MTKRQLLKIVNPLLGILMVNQTLTGLCSDLMSFDLFHLLHKGGWALAPLALLHLLLNWNWIRANFQKKPDA